MPCLWGRLLGGFCCGWEMCVCLLYGINPLLICFASRLRKAVGSTVTVRNAGFVTSLGFYCEGERQRTQPRAWVQLVLLLCALLRRQWRKERLFCNLKKWFIIGYLNPCRSSVLESTHRTLTAVLDNLVSLQHLCLLAGPLKHRGFQVIKLVRRFLFPSTEQPLRKVSANFIFVSI